MFCCYLHDGKGKGNYKSGATLSIIVVSVIVSLDDLQLMLMLRLS